MPNAFTVSDTDGSHADVVINRDDRVVELSVRERRAVTTVWLTETNVRSLISALTAGVGVLAGTDPTRNR